MLENKDIQRTVNRAFDVLRRLKEKCPREYQEALNYVDGINESAIDNHDRTGDNMR
jgi:hypothetical protein